jgi:acetolactate synthase-1/2/3 large subunit
VEGKAPLTRQAPAPPVPPPQKVEQAARIISESSFPLIMVGNGVIRGRASAELVAFAEKLNIPVATTFMAKGAIPYSHPLSLGTVGLQAHDYVACGFDRADVIICVGYDMVEYGPERWHPGRDRKLIHIDATAAEVDEHYILAVGVVGDIGESLRAIAERAEPRADHHASELRHTIVRELEELSGDPGFPVKPQRVVWDLREALNDEDIVICDVGAHKLWMARMFRAERPNTCIISNGFASMGISVPGAIAAKLAYPERKAVAVTGDGSFLMNSQELETAVRIGTPIVVLIWNDGGYGVIQWHQQREFGRESHVKFGNPDFVRYAESFGAKGYRVESADELAPTLQRAIEDDTVVVIDCPVDYSENMKLTKKLGELAARM